MVYRHEPEGDPAPEDPASGTAPSGSGPTAGPETTRATTPPPQPATPGAGGPALRAVEPLGLFGAGRQEWQRRGRGWQALVGGSAIVVLLALCGVAVATLVQDTTGTLQAGPSGGPTAERSATAAGADLDSRDTDRVALTAEEVFPGRQLVVSDGEPAYEVLKTSSSGSCAVAASGEIAELLDRLGCSQVVRATLRSADGGYLLTAGLFNLTDAAGAEGARDRIRQLLDERRGRFRGMATGYDTQAVAQAAAQVGWQVRGHYLAYCLVTRADGERIAAGDAEVRDILYDVIERYLNRGVLERRANGAVSPR
jgi:hypothetical protein